MAEKTLCVSQQQTKPIKISKWKVRQGNTVPMGRIILLYHFPDSEKVEQKKLKAPRAGIIHRILAAEGTVVQPGEALYELQACRHPTIMNDMCAECGEDLRKDDNSKSTASVPMIHAIPELKVSEEQAQKLGQADSDRLIKDRKLVLLVDLDQTLIHTTNDNIPPNIRDVHHFQLYGSRSPWYHTRLRPGTHEFLSSICALYELHICTFGARNYAHMIAMFLDQDQKYFSNRILSRDECFDPTSKKANLKALFPCGDDMVCIIDDREDVWSHATNLIHVKPYHFFQHTGDINAPPGLDKHEADDKEGVDLTKIVKNKKQIVDSKKDVAVEKTAEEGNKEKDINEKMSCGTQDEESKTDTKNDNETDELKKLNNKENEHAEEEKSANISNDGEITTNDKSEETDKKDELDGHDGDIKKTSKAINVDVKNDEIKDNLIDIEDPDDYLLYLQNILKRIHKYYYELYDKMESGKIPDLKKVIPYVKSRVLNGCTLVFSGLVPTHQKLEQSRAYEVAKSLGAVVNNDLDNETTHLVAVRPGTAKVNAGKRKKNLKIVTPDWLWCCAERWEHVEECIFPLNAKGSKNRHPPPHCSSPPHNPSYPENAVPKLRKRTLSGRFMDTIHPLMTFSSDEIADMDKEVEDILDDGESDESEEEVPNIEEDNDDPALKSIYFKHVLKNEILGSYNKEADDEIIPKESESENEEASNKRKRVDEDDSSQDEDLPSQKFRRGGELYELDMDSQDNDSDSFGAPEEDDDGEWNELGAELEREFLS